MNILGRSDRVDLPELGVQDIHAKVDTGAFTSSLHCSRAEVIDGVLEFVLLDYDHPEYTGTTYRFAAFEERDIKNSFGEVERRYVINTMLTIFDEKIITEFSLCNRGSLKFPVLIGRKILYDRFLIDITKKDLSFRQKRRKQSRRKKRI
ncbi:MAG TPA: RimK/LysX family protein [Chryseolinea sp.]|nr:RimK/LysX family protein [Chryseolinea sp.]